MKTVIVIFRTILGLFVIGIGYAIYYLANGCYCDSQNKLCDVGLVERIEYSDSASCRVIIYRDSIELIVNVLNQSIKNTSHGKISKNKYTDDIFRLKVFSNNGDFIRLDVKRINENFYYLYYQRNDAFFKQCVLSNNGLNKIIW